MKSDAFIAVITLFGSHYELHSHSEVVYLLNFSNAMLLK